MGGATFVSMEAVATPIIGFLRQFFNVEVLVCLGVNDLCVTEQPYTITCENIVKFNPNLTDPDKDTVPPRFLNFFYITIPFIPLLAHLNNVMFEQ